MSPPEPPAVEPSNTNSKLPRDVAISISSVEAGLPGVAISVWLALLEDRQVASIPGHQLHQAAMTMGLGVQGKQQPKVGYCLVGQHTRLSKAVAQTASH
ncbi:hypothetical protein HPB52_013157 [Rhipicephalus sanguineus]|uniref:Uncharacterized protein n=1 Tax=Rhipicephalus sanguineus TaxID=34632 RepID=A0A9D4TA07_RHISA|nr:hypothetical protein HPB52_013157 [Rhipicephalus sanguineus]